MTEEPIQAEEEPIGAEPDRDDACEQAPEEPGIEAPAPDDDEPVLTLNDLLGFEQKDLKNIRIRLLNPPADDRGNDPIKQYVNDPEDVTSGWMFWQLGRKADDAEDGKRDTARMFRVGNIAIGLIQLGPNSDRWLLATVKTITSDNGGYKYGTFTGDDVEKYRPYFGRVIVNYKRRGSAQNPIRRADTNPDLFTVEQVLPKPYDPDAHWPGYDNVRVTYRELKRLITGKRQNPEWVNSLRQQLAVYCITDLNTGKLYIGSATSEEGGLLTRWRGYVNDLTGGNKELNTIRDTLGEDYIRDNFQYSILEAYNHSRSDDYVLEREKWWKKTLDSYSPHGYNDN
ncbi:GIY-YIG nuclease family protein [Bifidobacterium tissieri]|nr:GIY-YIG nuclease family protein [Bifidobacterium tissieri]